MNSARALYINSRLYFRSSLIRLVRCAGVFLLITAMQMGGASPPASDPGEAEKAPVITPAQVRPEYDVIIAGAGTGGTMAAVQAARLGSRVLLVEETDWIGGQMSAAGVTSMDEAGDRVRRRGLYREFTDRVSRYYAALGLSTDTCAITENHFAVEPRVARRILTEMLAEARSPEGEGGVDLLLLSRVIGVKKDGDRVTGVDLLSGLEGTDQVKRSVGSRILIDATELGSVLPLTGARYRLGKGTFRSEAEAEAAPDSRIQDFTWTAVIKAYSDEAPPELILRTPPPGYDRSHFAAALNSPLPDKSTKPWSWQRFIDYRGMPDSSRPDPSIRNPWARVTRTHMNIAANDVDLSALDLVDPVRYRQKEYELKTKTLGLLYYIQNDMDAPMTTWTVAMDEGYDTPYNRLQNERLVGHYPELKPFLPVLNHFPVMPYARESRRVVGVKTMRARDIDRRSGPLPQPHAVAVGDYPVDLHGSDRPQHIEGDLDEPGDLGAIGFSPDQMGPFPVPFEALIPETVDGLLAAEKNISQSRLVNGATRLQPSTMLTGQAAGAIAGLAVRHDVEPRALRPIVVQDALLEAGDVLVARRDGMEDFPGVEPGTPLWRDVQLALLYGALQPGDAGGWRRDWRVLLGEAGPRGWDADDGQGLTFRGTAGLALLQADLNGGSSSASLADGGVRVEFRLPEHAQVGMVARFSGPAEFYSARLYQNALEILRWEKTTITLLARKPFRAERGATVTLMLELDGPRLAAELNQNGDLLASCTTTASLPVTGAVGLRLHGTEPVELTRFEVLSPSGESLFATAFPPALDITRASPGPERAAELRKLMASTGATSLIAECSSCTLADWARAFAGRLRQQTGGVAGEVDVASAEAHVLTGK